jgi:acyl-CoA thioester hydrolase
MAFSIRVQVRYAECDMQGHVFNAHYLTWFDMAHTGLLTEALGMAYTELVASGGDVVVSESGVRYLAPARFEDELEIAVELDPPTNSSLTSRFTVGRGDEVIARGFLRHVCVSPETLAKIAWPERARAAFAPYVTGGDL